MQSITKDDFWDIVIALSGLEDYAGRVERNGDLTLKPIDQIKPPDRIASLPDRRSPICPKP